MERYPRRSAVSPLPAHVKTVSKASNQREDNGKTQSASEVLRRVVLQQGFVAKPTPYAPSGKQDEHPLIDAHTQLQARLQALQDVRQRLRFAPSTDRSDRFGWRSSSDYENNNSNNSEDMDMTDSALSSPSLSRFPRDSMQISTRVALSAQANSTEDWVHDGGIVALGGLETLFFGFLTPQELVTAGAVCQSWYALARRDIFWEPLLVTPVEKYPLRSFLGFQSSSLPALQVYIIYRKIRSQLQTLDSKTDESPRQSPEPLRFAEAIRRYEGGDDHLPNLIDDIRHRRVLRVPTGATQRAGVGADALGLRNLRLQSVHLVYAADEPLTEEVDDAGHVDDAFDDEDDVLPRPRTQTRLPFETMLPVAPLAMRALPRPTWAPMPGAAREPGWDHDALMANLLDNVSDEEIWDDRNDGDRDGNTNGDVAMMAPEPLAVAPPLQRQSSQSKIAVDGCRRVRLVTWLAANGRVSRKVFRSFARQLLIALTTLELSQYAHSDVCAGNIFVVDRGSASSSSSTGTPSNQTSTGEDDGDAVHSPLFQLYCRKSANIWSLQRALTAVDELAQRNRQRNLFGLDADLGRRDADEVPGLLRRLMAARAARPGHHDLHGARLGAAPPPLNASYAAMVRSYIRVLREVWCHTRVSTTHDRTLPLLSLIFQRPQLVGSVTMRSFFEYAEYLVSTNEATPSRLLEHVYMQTANSGAPIPRFVVGRSSVRPTLCGNAEDYRTQVMAWHARHLNARPRTPQRALPASILSSTSTPPLTKLGPAFFHDALSESRLPHQRFLSVVAPKTASSSWVHKLAVSQRFTLEQLDLSQVQLPLSILLRELYHLQRLTHLRLPREILRDENMEQFIAAVWCVGLLPSLSVMDESVKKALDRMEYGYVTQLNIMASLLDRSRPHKKLPAMHPSLQHTFSSPF